MSWYKIAPKCYKPWIKKKTTYPLKLLKKNNFLNFIENAKISKNFHSRVGMTLFQSLFGSKYYNQFINSNY